MMIDENQTPVGEQEAQEKPETVAPASDAAPMEIPSDETTTAEPTAAQPETTAETAVATAEPVAEAVPEPEPPAPVAEAPKVAAPEPGAPAKSDEDLFESYMSALEGGEGFETDGSFKKLSKGDRVEATIIQVDRDRVFVDLGTKSEGIVPLDELTSESIESAHDHFSVGDKINVVVIRPEGGEGNAIVSKKRADFEETWDKIEQAFKSQEMITAQVVDRVKGGLVVDVGVRGFVPATHVGSGKLRNIEKYVGQPLQLKVIEIDRERKKVVLSNREAEEQRRARA